MSSNVTSFPRSIRPAPSPLGLYIRAGRNDHKELLNFLASGDAGFCGVVLDATQSERDAELREHVLGRRLDAILDPCTQQSAMPGGYTPAHGKLPWGKSQPHTMDDFVGAAGRRLIAALANTVKELNFTEVIAPTHFIDGADDPWLEVDVESVRRLRRRLDGIGADMVPIVYSLALPYAVFRNPEQRQLIIERLRDAPIEAVWLKVGGLGAANTATATCNYISATRDFFDLGVPVVGDHIGGLTGLSLLASGAVGGLAHGLAMKERFDARSWARLGGSRGFMPQPRVYFPHLDLMLERDAAKVLLESAPRAKTLFGCRDTACCRRGITDMLENPARHFLYQRTRQIQELSGIPEHLRLPRFLEKHVRPTTDQALKVATMDWNGNEQLARKAREHRKRLDNLRVALGELSQRHPPRHFALLPETRAAREARV